MKLCKVILASLSLLCCSILLAQGLAKAPDRQASEGEKTKMQSPAPFELLSDNRVTFRFRSKTEATQVAVEGEWPGGIAGRSVIPMTKNEQSVWTVTVGPLPSDVWKYSFVVDGQPVAPSFGRFGGSSVLPDNMIVIPGAYGSDYMPKGAPRGSLVYAHVPFMDSIKDIEVFLPPAYFESPDKKYPVLYLTMGGGGRASGKGEDPSFIMLENMYSSGRATPMIVVTLDPGAPGGDSIGWTTYQGGGNQTSERYIQAAQAVADEIVPWVDKVFRTIPDRDHRAIIGFSSPGAQGFMAGARNPDKFSTIGTFSGGYPTWPGVGVQIQSTLDPKQYRGPDITRVPDMEKLGAMIPKLNASAKMKLVALYVGTAEPLIQTQHLMTKLLDDRGVKYIAIENPGQVHDIHNVSISLHDFATRVFK